MIEPLLNRKKEKMFKLIKRKDGNFILEISPWAESLTCDDGTIIYPLTPNDFEFIKEEIIESGIKQLSRES